MRFISYAILLGMFFAASYVPTASVVSAADTESDIIIPDESALESPDAHRDGDIITEVTPLGEARDTRGQKVKGFKIIHKKNAAAQPRVSRVRGNTSSCYGLMARGAKWKTTEPWVMNPANPSGLNQNDLFNTVQNSITQWEDAADGVLGSGPGLNIIGDGTTTATPLVADQAQPDGQNEIYFGSVGPTTIAITIVWGVWGGLTSKRQLVEWDQIYNTVYAWSLTGEAGKMDFPNIATHEMGHAIGLADLYKSSCNLQTMYGYAELGQTIKQTLEIGDITGIKTLYK